MGAISAYKGHVSRTQCSMRSANQLELLAGLQLALTNIGTPLSRIDDPSGEQDCAGRAVGNEE
jgi:hypothetical protein